MIEPNGAVLSVHLPGGNELLSNQLVVLCNMGRIKEVHLDDAWQTLSQVYLKLRELAEQERT